MTVRQDALFSCSVSATEILRTLLRDPISQLQAATIACLSPLLLNTCSQLGAARFSAADAGGRAETCGAELSGAETFSAGSWAARTI